MQWLMMVPVVLVLVTTSGGTQTATPFGVAVQALLERPMSTTEAPGHPRERQAVAQLYRSSGFRPLWTTERELTPQALSALRELASSDLRGLPSSIYDVPSLRALAVAAPGSVEDAARFDIALSGAIARLLAHLHAGRVDPTTLRFDLPNAYDQVDLPALVASVARATDVAAAVSAAEPVYAGYHALTRALSRYRRLAADSTLRAPARAPKTIHPGDGYADVAALARLLRALGDLTSDGHDTSEHVATDSAGAPVYDAALVDAVTRFQRRHGLDADGALGPATMVQLRVPLARRVRQIELTLERWRWLPDRPPSRYIVVNIPGFQLYAFEDDAAAERPTVTMNVIVGQAERRHNTPVFTATMTEVVFRPYWDVPPRIARVELIPIFRRRPQYFDAEGFEIVRRGTGDVPVATFPPTEINFGRVIAGELRLRQRPGPANALGAVKFVFPNRYQVYLHDTPTQNLFSRTQRDYSHGCIRIAEPPTLAEYVLRGQTPWNRVTISDAMTGDRTLRVPVARPPSVFVLYATAVVDAGDVVSFYADLYGHDAALARALGLGPIESHPAVSPAAVISR